MKKTLSFLCTAAIALSLAATAGAQAAGPKEGQKPAFGSEKRQAAMKKMRAELLAKLDLSDEQKQKVEALDKKFAEDLKAAMKASKGDREAAKGKMGEMRKSHQEAMMKILTPEQQRKFMDFRKEAMKKARAERQSGGAKKPDGKI